MHLSFYFLPPTFTATHAMTYPSNRSRMKVDPSPTIMARASFGHTYMRACGVRVGVG